MDPVMNVAARRALHLPAALALLLAGAVLGAAAWAMKPPSHGGKAAAPAACATAAQRTPVAAPHDALPPQAEPAMLGALRIAASRGDLDASAALGDLLLDRYEQAHDDAALVEALQWLQRDWEQPGFRAFEQIARVAGGACTHNPLLRMHWLCQQGE